MSDRDANVSSGGETTPAVDGATREFPGGVAAPPPARDPRSVGFASESTPGSRQVSIAALPTDATLVPPDGSRLAFLKDGRLWAFDRDSGIRPLAEERSPDATSEGAQTPTIQLSPGVSPDGQWVAFSRHADGVTSALVVVDWNTGLERVLVRRSQFAQAAPAAQRRPQVISGERPSIGPGLWWHPESTGVAFGAVDVFVDDDNQIRSNPRHDVWMAPIDRDVPFLLLEPGQAFQSAVSPDGEWVAAFRVEGLGQNERAVLSVKPLGGRQSRVLFSTTGLRPGRADGPYQWTRGPVAVRPVWAPDSGAVYVAYPLHGDQPEDHSSLFKMTLVGEAETLLDLGWRSVSADTGYRPFLSPDGLWVVHTLDAAHTEFPVRDGYPKPGYPEPILPTPSLQLWLSSLPSGQQVALTAAPLGIRTAAWAPDGRRVAVFVPLATGVDRGGAATEGAAEPGELVVADLGAIRGSADTRGFDRAQDLSVHSTAAVTAMTWLSSEILALQRPDGLVLLDVTDNAMRFIPGVTEFSTMPAERQ